MRRKPVFIGCMLAVLGAPSSLAFGPGGNVNFGLRQKQVSDNLQLRRINESKAQLLENGFHVTKFQLFSSQAQELETLGGSILTGPAVLQLQELTCSHDGGTTFQLEKVSHVIPGQAKIGLLGRNGCGKSTLLRIMAMETIPELKNTIDDIKYTGNVIKTNKQCRVAYVEQEPPSNNQVTVGAALLGITPADLDQPQLGGTTSPYEAAKRYKLAEMKMSSDPSLDADYRLASEAMDSTNGWFVLNKVEEVATKLRVSHLIESKLSEISGGERKRVALTAALITEPDVLLLDEPTNHLDLNAIRWLSDYLLSTKRLTCLVVTHDRAFLNQVCRDGILELDRGTLSSYEGTYERFLQAKQERLELEGAAFQAAKNKYKTELDWMRRQPQARETKSKARIDAFYKLQKAVQPRSADPKLTKIDAQEARRLGNTVLKCNGVSLKFDNKVMLDGFTYDFNRGDRIGIVGANGVGKVRACFVFRYCCLCAVS